MLVKWLVTNIPNVSPTSKSVTNIDVTTFVSLKKFELVVLYLLLINARIFKNNLWSKYFTCNIVFNLQADAIKINSIKAFDFVNQKAFKRLIISEIISQILNWYYQCINKKNSPVCDNFLKFFCGKSLAGTVWRHVQLEWYYFKQVHLRSTLFNVYNTPEITRGSLMIRVVHVLS